MGRAQEGEDDMTPRSAFLIAGAGALSWVVIGLVALLAFALAGCATTARPGGRPAEAVAATLAYCLKTSPWDKAAPLACACVADAEAGCRRRGLPPKCYADGWIDRDREWGSWTMAACRQMQEEKP